jgi:hypothetical protein
MLCINRGPLATSA